MESKCAQRAVRRNTFQFTISFHSIWNHYFERKKNSPFEDTRNVLNVCTWTTFKWSRSLQQINKCKKSKPKRKKKNDLSTSCCYCRLYFVFFFFLFALLLLLFSSYSCGKLFPNSVRARKCVQATKIKAEPCVLFLCLSMFSIREYASLNRRHVYTRLWAICP